MKPDEVGTVDVGVGSVTVVMLVSKIVKLVVPKLVTHQPVFLLYNITKEQTQLIQMHLGSYFAQGSKRATHQLTL